MSSTRTGFCECGCGQRTRLASQHDRARGDIKGQPVRFVRGHGGSLNRGRILKEHVAAYRLTTRKGRREFLHRLRAEAALGKPLPLGAQVHHLDGTKGDNSPLVICQDDAYHKFSTFSYAY